MVVTMTLSETITGAMFYMYFVALSGGLGLLTVAWIGFKLYKRQERKNGSNHNKQQRRGMKNGAI